MSVALSLSKKIRVLVVDDSLLMRNMVSDILSGDKAFEVVGTASDGKMAVEKCRQLKPDAMTLDVEMPVMDGIECLRNIMKDCPTPVVMVSSITYEGSFKTMQALSAGAFDFVQKPMAQASSALANVADDIRAKVKAAVSSGYIKKKAKDLSLKAAGPSSTLESRAALNEALPGKLAGVRSVKDYVIAVGISTGGPPCVSKIFEEMPEKAPPILVVQHMPEGFTKAMADRINSVSKMTVKEAANGDIIKPGMGFIAPGSSHIKVVRAGGGLQIQLSKDPPMSGHRPSADYLFQSVAEACGAKAIGVIMTGMGRDGATHLKRMRETGAHTIAQDEESCVVYGMPKIAAQEGAADEILSLDGIVKRLKQIASRAG